MLAQATGRLRGVYPYLSGDKIPGFSEFRIVLSVCNSAPYIYEQTVLGTWVTPESPVALRSGRSMQRRNVQVQEVSSR